MQVRLTKDDDDDFEYPFDWRRFPAKIDPVEGPKDETIVAVRCPVNTKMTREQIALAGQRCVEQELASRGQLSVRTSPLSRRQARELLRSHVRFAVVLDFMAPRSVMLSGVIHEAAEFVYKAIAESFPLALSQIIIGITDETRVSLPTAETLMRSGSHDHIDNDHAFVVSPNGRLEAAQLRQRIEEAETNKAAFTGIRLRRPDRKRAKYRAPDPPEWLAKVEAKKREELARQEQLVQMLYESESRSRRHDDNGVVVDGNNNDEKSSNSRRRRAASGRAASASSSMMSNNSKQTAGALVSPSSSPTHHHGHHSHSNRPASLPPAAAHARVAAAAFEPVRPLPLGRCSRCAKFDVEAAPVVRDSQRKKEWQIIISQKESEKKKQQQQEAERAQKQDNASSPSSVLLSNRSRPPQSPTVKATTAPKFDDSRNSNIKNDNLRKNESMLSTEVSLSHLTAVSSSQQHGDDQQLQKQQRQQPQEEPFPDYSGYRDPTIGALRAVLDRVARRQQLKSVTLLPVVHSQHHQGGAAAATSPNQQ